MNPEVHSDGCAEIPVEQSIEIIVHLAYAEGGKQLGEERDEREKSLGLEGVFFLDPVRENATPGTSAFAEVRESKTKRPNSGKG